MSAHSRGLMASAIMFALLPFHAMESARQAAPVRPSPIRARRSTPVAPWIRPNHKPPVSAASLQRASKKRKAAHARSSKRRPAKLAKRNAAHKARNFWWNP